MRVYEYWSFLCVGYDYAIVKSLDLQSPALVLMVLVVVLTSLICSLLVTLAAFYRAMHFSAKRGIGVESHVVCLSVPLSICNVGGL